MARNGKTKVTKGVVYVDSKGKRHVLNKEEFRALMLSLATRAKANKDIAEELPPNTEEKEEEG